MSRWEGVMRASIGRFTPWFARNRWLENVEFQLRVLWFALAHISIESLLTTPPLPIMRLDTSALFRLDLFRVEVFIERLATALVDPHAPFGIEGVVRRRSANRRHSVSLCFALL